MASAMLHTACNIVIKSMSLPSLSVSYTPLVNLRLFNGLGNAIKIHSAGLKGYAGQRKPTAQRKIRVQSRKRNIFLNPKEVDESLTSLYDSSRFNRDDSDDEDNWDQPTASITSPTTPPLVKKAAQQQQQQRGGAENDGDDDDDQADGPSASVTRSGLILPPPRNVRVKTAEFIKSSPSVKDCPAATYPEFAVIGRSNVGKSSLINLITGRNALAMVSKTPGKTRLINHFLINGAWYLVDLPGYGYARASKEKVIGWNTFTREYFLERETLCSVLLLIDASIPPMPLDLACANWLGEAEVPYTIVYTKLDKRKKGGPPADENILAIEEQLLQNWEVLPAAIATSSKSGEGKTALLAHIASLRGLYHQSKV